MPIRSELASFELSYIELLQRSQYNPLNSIQNLKTQTQKPSTQSLPDVKLFIFLYCYRLYVYEDSNNIGR